MFDHAPFYWKPEGFETEDEVSTWLMLLGMEGMSVEAEGERVYFRSLCEAQFAVKIAENARVLSRENGSQVAA